MGAELHHPISFNRNLIKFRNAWRDDDYETAGVYSGKDMKYLLDEVEGVAKPESFNDFEQFIDNFFLHAVDVPL